jgi:predicted Zn-dependent protease
MPTLTREYMETLEILGHVYFLQGRFKEAGIVFKGILAMDAQNRSALGHLAALDIEEGAGENALRSLETYARTQKQEEPAPAFWLLRAQALRQAGQTEEARQAMAEYLARAAMVAQV